MRNIIRKNSIIKILTKYKCCLYTSINNKNVYDYKFYNKIKDKSNKLYNNSVYRKTFFEQNIKYLCSTSTGIKNNFNTILYIGSFPDKFLEYMPNHLVPRNYIFCNFSKNELLNCYKNIKTLYSNNIISKSLSLKNIHSILINNEDLPFKNSSIDLIVSNLNLHSINNLDNYFSNLSNILVEDGCLLSDFVSSGSFNELNTVLSYSELEREGGLSPNILRFKNFQDISSYINKYNFNLSSFNINRYCNFFNNFNNLLQFFQEIGETNYLINRRICKTKDTFVSASALYSNMFNYNNYQKIADESFLTKYKHNYFTDELKNFIYMTYEITSFIGWKYNKKTHQKPKERGSAEVNLKDIVDYNLDEENNIIDDTIRYGTLIEKKNNINYKNNYERIDDINNDEYEIYDLTDKMKKLINEKKRNKSQN